MLGLGTLNMVRAIRVLATCRGPLAVFLYEGPTRNFSDAQSQCVQ